MMGGDAGGAMSVAYSPPERLLNPGRRPTQAGDVYSYAMLLYELAARAAPWAGAPPMVVGVAVGQGSRPELEVAIPEEIAEGYVRLMRDCWAHSAAQRPSFAEVARRVRALCDKLPPPASRAGSGGFGGQPPLRRMSSSLERARASASAARAEARLAREREAAAQAQLASASDDRSELRAQVSQLEAAAVAAAQAVQRTERARREEAERAQECGVCLCERKTHMFTPCGHKCVCEGCADELLRRGDRCPVCRAALEGAVRVFD